MTDALIIEGLAKSFGELRAVDGISLSVREGEMFGIVGPNGSGKTTLFRMLCGIMKPSGGTARIFGHDINNGMEQIKRQIGYFSQRFTLYGDLSVDENIEFFAEIHGVPDYRPFREELLAFTRLTPFRGRLADRLSGGMKQKLALACTLIHRPRLILLDEPTTGVDPISRMDFWKILSALLKTNITIVMSTPYLDEAERCSRVALMNKGTVMALDTPANIKKQMRGEVLEIVCGEIRTAARLLKGAEGILDVQTFGDRLNVVVENSEAGHISIESILRDGGISITDWRPVKPSLENVFLSLITRAA